MESRSVTGAGGTAIDSLRSPGSFREASGGSDVGKDNFVLAEMASLRRRLAGRYTWNLSAEMRIFCRRLLKIAQRLHAQTGRDFVVRQEKEVGLGRLTELTREIARAAGGDRHNRCLWLLDACRNAIEEIANL